ncbi:hypothetical protein RHSIM_RhsimUnG0210900 [Rhododendron simsii]|uniref:Uncharacterized protein n=1 Tax=Rhododendron simsii TaxID=118357 RepID=A0A834FU84_RHOSS|nr:hypothetical protein RHSIM_RhsimUnG0210900 [Rhododendron simsii]
MCKKLGSFFSNQLVDADLFVADRSSTSVLLLKLLLLLPAALLLSIMLPSSSIRWFLATVLVLLVSVLSKFAIPENNSAREAIKKKTLKLLWTRLRDWRCTLKGKYFDEAKTAAQIVATAPPIVNHEHFADLVRYWFSEEGKNLSSKNKRGEDKSASVHTAGSKSYA